MTIHTCIHTFLYVLCIYKCLNERRRFSSDVSTGLCVTLSRTPVPEQGRKLEDVVFGSEAAAATAAGVANAAVGGEPAAPTGSGADGGGGGAVVVGGGKVRALCTYKPKYIVCFPEGPCEVPVCLVMV